MVGWTDDDVCPITLEKLTHISLENRYTLLPCNHTFEKNNIFRSLHQNARCPTCRHACTERDNPWTRSVSAQEKIEQQILSARQPPDRWAMLQKTIEFQTEAIQRLGYIIIGQIVLFLLMSTTMAGPAYTVATAGLTSGLVAGIFPFLWNFVGRIKEYSLEWRKRVSWSS